MHHSVCIVLGNVAPKKKSHWTVKFCPAPNSQPNQTPNSLQLNHFNNIQNWFIAERTELLTVENVLTLTLLSKRITLWARLGTESIKLPNYARF